MQIVAFVSLYASRVIGLSHIFRHQDAIGLLAVFLDMLVGSPPVTSAPK